MGRGRGWEVRKEKGVRCKRGGGSVRWKGWQGRYKERGREVEGIVEMKFVIGK